ncbi:acyltransferase [Bradyrhizobium sp. 200]|uniref:acyltransferase family protein n=1 Tax=Bradyrhizobium sp. 200 TaxID=2782665 RepID=UPI0020001446|nr:acyltransferase [Bradyrhizobium sp. 200]UPJ51755.1 acyltransferase [Bradyrhizobium sp. 200]
MKYEPAFDGLRAVAIIFVFLDHAWESAFPGGWAGVDIFFVLSGYLITTLLTNELSETGTIDYRNFYIRRVLRLWPAFAVFLFVVVLEISISKGPKTWSFEAVAVSSVYLMNWNRAFIWWDQYKLGHTWSLAMEQFYLLWPALLVFIFARRAIGCVLVLIVVMVTWRCFLALNGADPERTYNGFDTHGDALLIGCLLALLVRRNPDPTIKFTGMWLVASVGLLAILLLLPHRNVLTQTAGLSIAAMLSAVMIASLRHVTPLKSILSVRPLVYVGTISYGFYLWHYPIVLGLSKYGNMGKMAALMLSFGLASASYHWIELPFLAQKKQFSPRPTRAQGTGAK